MLSGIFNRRVSGKKDKHRNALTYFVLFGVAFGAPTLLIFSAGLNHSFYEQAIAVAAWGVLINVLPKNSLSGIKFDGCPSACVISLVLAAASAVLTSLPYAIDIKYVGILVAAMLVFNAGMTTQAPQVGKAICFTIVAFSLLNCSPAFVQAFHREWVDDRWIASAWSPDRISGNIRQPNLLATMCALGVAAVGALVELSIMVPVAAFAAVAVLSLTVALTGSRVGFAELTLIALVGLGQPLLKSAVRRLMLMGPVLALAFWSGLQAWSHVSGALHGRVPELVSGRYVMWQQCLHLIAMHPWFGVGFGNFNFAWTLTPFDRSNPETFDHAHNLILQWAVEFGIPMTALLVGLLGWSFWRCVRLARQATGEDAILRRFCLLMVALVLLHSMTEYPLWYAYFLLPTVFAWGIAAAPLAAPEDRTAATIATDQTPRTNWLGLSGLLMALGAAFAVYDYQKIVTIYHPYDDTPIEQRVAEGRKSILYGHLADRFAGTLAVNGTRTLEPFKTATRQLLDMRLLIAWSLAMRETGHLDKARYLAQRVKDFNDPVAKQFFEKCTQPVGTADRPWQCTPPTGHYTYQDFL